MRERAQHRAASRAFAYSHQASISSEVGRMSRISATALVMPSSTSMNTSSCSTLSTPRYPTSFKATTNSRQKAASCPYPIVR